MLTFLTILEGQGKTLFPLKNKITVQEETAKGLTVRHITCLNNRGKIPYEKIAKLCHGEESRVLAQESLTFPENCCLRRFESRELRSRLCLNMALEVLKNLSKKGKDIKVGIFDPYGKIADGAGSLLRYTKSLKVVTASTDVYSAEASRLMEESGAVMSVSRRLRTLSELNLILAPTPLNLGLPLRKDAVILTVTKPKLSQKCAVFYRYSFTLEEELENLIPEGVENEYFASALYTLKGRFDLGSYIPQAVSVDSCIHTLVSLTKYLMNIGSNT